MADPDADTTGVSIRRARPDDADALAHLHVDVWDDAYAGLVPQGILDDRRDRVAERVENWRRILTEAEQPTYVAEDAGGLVGFATSGPARDNAWTSSSSCGRCTSARRTTRQVSATPCSRP
jgi:hypothetical protein